jgi:RNA polymerase sigma factor (sigma-70 family)
MTDGELLTCFVSSKDDNALAALVRRHAQMVWGVCRRLLNHHDAEDAFQATFLVLVRKAADVPRQAVANWLYGVARQTAVRLRAMAAKQGLRERQVVNMPEPTVPEVPDAALQRVVDEELSRLPDHYRSVVVLCDLEDMTRKEAAQQLGIPEGSVASRLARARTLLKKRLQKRGVVLSGGSVAVVLSAGSVSTSAPPDLVAFTIKAASLLAAGRAAGLASAKVAALAQEVVDTMTVNKFKIAMGVVAAALAVTTLTYSMMVGGQPSRGGDDKTRPEPPRVDNHGDPLPEGAIARFGTVQFRRPGGFARASAIGPDGKSFLDLDDSLLLRTYDLASGRVLKTTQLSGERPQQLQISQNGRVVIGQINYGQSFCCAWDAESGRVIGRWSPPQNFWANQETISADGKIVAIIAQGPGPTKVVLWEPKSGVERMIARSTDFPVRFSQDGKRIFTTDGSSYFAFDTATGKELWSYKGATQRSDSYPSQDGKSLLIWQMLGNPSTLVRLDAVTGKPISGDRWPILKGNETFAFLPDGRILIFGSYPRGVRVWDPVLGKEMLPIPELGWLAISPDGKSAVGTYEGAGEIQRWDLTTGKPMWPDRRDLGHTAGVSRLAFDPTGRRLATVGDDNTVRIWDVANRKLVLTAPLVDHNFNVLSFTPDSRHIFVGSRMNLFQFDAISGKKVLRLPVPAARSWGDLRGNLDSCRVTSNGSEVLGIVAAPMFNNGFIQNGNSLAVFGYELQSGKLQFIREVSADGYHAGQSPDASLIAFQDGRIQDTRSGREMGALALLSADQYGHWTRPSFTFSRDNRMVAAGVTHLQQTSNRFETIFKGVQTWDVVTGQALAHIGSGELGCIAVSPDGRILATANCDSLCGWDVITGEQLWKYSLGRMSRSVYTFSFTGYIEFSPDGRSIATAMPDSTVLLWEVPTPRRKPAPLATTAEKDAAWDALISGEATKSVASALALVDAGADAVALLRNRLKPVKPIPEEKLRRYIADLGDPAFARREAAAKELARLGEQCEPALRAALMATSSAEQRSRIEKLLAAPFVALPETVRFLRAVQVLELIRSPAAQALLEDLATGDPAAPETKAATAALARLPHR